MTKNIALDYSKALGFFREEEIANVATQVKAAHDALHNKTGAGNDFLGWIDLPVDYDKEELQESKRLRKKSDRIRTFWW